ncbi:MAG TPA: isocitrate/isopropylmalate family dehydrogenase, partial [Methanobacterium sp.]|nr:isocitrate/isopropylmalate family dehydrogenase [Methanobacterium sp.]
MILSAVLMLDYLGENEAARQVEQALTEVLREGKRVTTDMNGNASTMDMAREIRKKLAAILA